MATARRRCGRFTNINLLRSSGRDLALFRDASFDPVYAVDTFRTFCYQAATLQNVTCATVLEVLRPRGTLLVLNYS